MRRPGVSGSTGLLGIRRCTTATRPLQDDALEPWVEAKALVRDAQVRRRLLAGDRAPGIEAILAVRFMALLRWTSSASPRVGASMTTSLQIRAGVASIAPTGELDAATIGELMQLGELALAQTDTRILRVDFSHVTFIDSSGIAGLVRLRQMALAGNQSITVANACTRVRKIFDIVGLSATLCTDVSPAADAVEV